MHLHEPSLICKHLACASNDDDPQDVAVVLTLISAIFDDRLDRTHLNVLLEHQAPRSALALWAGVSEKTVSNALSDLRRANYIPQLGPVLPLLTVPCLTVDEREAVWSKSDGICTYCSVQTTREPNQHTSFTVDHLVPIARGGANDPDNLVPCCAHCNFSKRAQHASDFADIGSGA